MSRGEVMVAVCSNSGALESVSARGIYIGHRRVIMRALAGELRFVAELGRDRFLFRGPV